MSIVTILRRDLKIPILAEILGIMLLMWSSHLRFKPIYLPRYVATDTCLRGSLLIDIDIYIDILTSAILTMD